MMSKDIINGLKDIEEIADNNGISNGQAVISSPVNATSTSDSFLSLSISDECIRLIQQKNIKVIVFDMDLTAVGQHSRGKLQRGSPLDEYLEKATPAFLELVPKLYHSGLKLAIATHSDEAEYNDEIQPKTHILGQELATALLKKHFPSNIASSFYIVAYNPRVHSDENHEHNQNKRYHIRKLIEHYQVKPNEILFFDDTEDVVQDCKTTCNIQHTYQVNPKYGFQYEDVLKNLR